MQEEAETAAVVLADDPQDKINAMTSIAPLIVGITGPSGVGKSTIAMQAAEKIREAVYCPIELPEFFLTTLSPGQSYSDRDPVSESKETRALYSTRAGTWPTCAQLKRLYNTTVCDGLQHLPM